MTAPNDQERDDAMALFHAADKQMRAMADQLKDPVAVHANMLRGTIAKPTWEQIKHLYSDEFAALSRAPVWHRIDDAENPPPKDGSDVTLCDMRVNGGRMIAACWHDDEGMWMSAELVGYSSAAFTHWQPLTAPQEGGE